MIIRKFGMAAVAAAILSVSAGSAMATTLRTVEFGGTLTRIGFDLTAVPGLQTGANATTGTFRLTYDPLTPLVDQNGFDPTYEFASAEFSIPGVTSFSLTTDPDLSFFRIIDRLPFGSDLFDVKSYEHDNATAPRQVEVFLQIRDLDGTAFSSNAVSQLTNLAASGDLSAFEHRHFTVVLSEGSSTDFGSCGYDDCIIKFSVDSIALVPVSPVPLPAGSFLMLGGLACLYGVKRRRRTA